MTNQKLQDALDDYSAEPADAIQLDLASVLAAGTALRRSARTRALIGGAALTSAVAGLTVAAAGFGAPTHSATATNPRSAAAVSTCTADHLAASGLSGEGAGGQSYFVVALRNTGSAPCVLVGYPDVTLLDAQSQPVGGASVARAGPPAAPVTVLPGQSAGVTVGTAAVGVAAPGFCQPRDVTSVRVRLPGTDSALLVDYQLQVCANQAGLTTGPVLLGTDVQPT